MIEACQELVPSDATVEFFAVTERDPFLVLVEAIAHPQNNLSAWQVKINHLCVVLNFLFVNSFTPVANINNLFKNW